MKHNPFDTTVLNIDTDKLIFHFINIEEYDKSFKELIDNYIVSI
ncbi:MAG: hypothetical protein U9O56_08375 [Campylobacterota bacterium]|nr:hypothetical protein [Campylobacterota bacterium]